MAPKFIWTILVLLLSLLISPAPALAAPPEPETRLPAGFQLILSDVGVELYRKEYPKGTPDFVQLIYLDQGARLDLLHGEITKVGEDKGVYGGDNPRFLQQPLERFWNAAKQSGDAFCVTNGLFFYMKDYPTRLAFPLKKDGQVITDGYGIKEYPDQKLMLELWDHEAKITELSQEALYSSSAPNIIAGLTEEANKRAKQFAGRTFVGVMDGNGDGLNEIVLIFNTLSAKQVDAAEVLRSFGAQSVMMLDGGGSTQLTCKDKNYIESDRFIPQALAVLAGPESALIQTETALNETQQALEALVEVVETQPTTTPEPIPTLTPEPIPEGVAGWLQQQNSGSGMAVLSGLKPSASIELSGILWIPAITIPVAFVLIFIALRMRRREYSLDIYDSSPKDGPYE